MSAVPYFDITAQYGKLEAQWFQAISRLGETGNFILGASVERFEREIAAYLNVRHAVTVASGTDALVLALKAVGFEPGQTVIVPAFGFFATAEAVTLAGGKPIFVDIHDDDFNISAQAVEDAIDDTTGAIIPVHLFGAPADMDYLCAIGEMHGIPVIEDAAQAFGTTRNGQFTGTFSDAGCFSFYPTKVLGAYGDGGMVVTNDDEIADQLKLLRNHGIVGANVHELVGCTSRLDSIQAELLSLKLRTVEHDIERRREIASRYIQRLADLEIKLPSEPANIRHCYNIFTIGSRFRDEIAQKLSANSCGYQIYYPLPLYRQKPYIINTANGQQPCVESEAACRTVISLPNFPEMPDSHVDRVCEVIRSVFD